MKSATAFAIFLVAIACSNFCKADSIVNAQSKKQAAAVLQDIVKSLTTDDDSTMQDDDSPDSLLFSQNKKNKDLPNHPGLAELLFSQNKNLPKPPKSAEVANYANLQKFAKAQGYVHIPYYIWNRYWPLYYYSYYRYRALRLIHHGH